MNRPTNSIRATGILVALGLASCGSGGGAGEGPLGGARVIELALGPAAPAPADAPPRVVARFDPPAELKDWSVDPGTGSVVADPRGVALGGGARKVLAIPVRLDLAQVGAVRLNVQVFAPVSLRAYLAGEGAPLATSRRADLRHVAGAQEVVLAFPPGGARGSSYDQLAIELRGPGQQLLVGAIELLERPPRELLPAAGDPARLIQFEGESRRALGLRLGERLEANARCTGDSELVFSYGFPRYTGSEERAAKLVLAIESSKGERFTAELTDPGEPPRWLFARLPLGRFAGSDCRFAFHVEADEPRASCALGEVRVCVRSDDAPTVLLVTSDTHRADHVGVARLGVDVRTPVLDALAARGLWFEDCQSSANVTNPSHIALMTGTSPRDTGILSNYVALSDAAPTLAERFREAGFVTFASVSAPHLGHRTSGLGQGFDRMSVPRRTRDAAQSIGALRDWLPDAEGLPLFVWLHVFDAHAPYEPPADLRSAFYPPERDPFDPSAPAPPVPRAVLPDEYLALKDLEYPKAMYRGEVFYLDRELGRLFGLPRFEDALVAFTADHGESFGEHGIYWNHEGLYPQTIHVPLVLAWPGAPSGERVSAPVLQMDVGRTLLDLAGLSSADFPGCDLVAIARGAPGEDPRFALGARYEDASITQSRWLLVLHLEERVQRTGSGAAHRHAVELYDLAADPACERDRLDGELERARGLWSMLVRWLGERRELGWSGGASQDEELLSELETLGYATSEDEPPGDALFDPECDCAWCARMRGGPAK